MKTSLLYETFDLICRNLIRQKRTITNLVHNKTNKWKTLKQSNFCPTQNFKSFCPQRTPCSQCDCWSCVYSSWLVWVCLFGPVCHMTGVTRVQLYSSYTVLDDWHSVRFTLCLSRHLRITYPSLQFISVYVCLTLVEESTLAPLSTSSSTSSMWPSLAARWSALSPFYAQRETWLICFCD